jgi:hypothetical protein
MLRAEHFTAKVLRRKRRLKSIMIWIIVRLLAAAFLAASFPSFAQWQALERELESYIKQHGIAQITDQPTIQGFIREKNVGGLLEMCFQRGRPLTVTAGFLGIRRVAPDEAFGLALRIGWNEDDKDGLAILMPYVYSRLSEQVNATEAEKALSAVMGTSPRDSKYIVAPLGAISTETLKRWLLRNNMQTYLPSNVSIAISICSTDAGWRKDFPREVKELLRIYADVPGTAQMVYLELYPHTDGHFMKILIGTLRNEDITDEDLLAILGRRRDIASKLLKDPDSHFSLKQRDRIMNGLNLLTPGEH